MKADQERVSKLLTDTVTLLCKNGLIYTDEIMVQGLLGITLDKKDVFIVQINEVIGGSGGGGSHNNESSSSTESSSRRKNSSAPDNVVDLTRLVDTPAVTAPPPRRPMRAPVPGGAQQSMQMQGGIHRGTPPRYYNNQQARAARMNNAALPNIPGITPQMAAAMAAFNNAMYPSGGMGPPGMGQGQGMRNMMPQRQYMPRARMQRQPAPRHMMQPHPVVAHPPSSNSEDDVMIIESDSSPSSWNNRPTPRRRNVAATGTFVPVDGDASSAINPAATITIQPIETTDISQSEMQSIRNTISMAVSNIDQHSSNQNAPEFVLLNAMGGVAMETEQSSVGSASSRKNNRSNGTKQAGTGKSASEKNKDLPPPEVYTDIAEDSTIGEIQSSSKENVVRKPSIIFSEIDDASAAIEAAAAAAAAAAMLDDNVPQIEMPGFDVLMTADDEDEGTNKAADTAEVGATRDGAVTADGSSDHETSTIQITDVSTAAVSSSDEAASMPTAASPVTTAEPIATPSTSKAVESSNKAEDRLNSEAAESAAEPAEEKTKVCRFPGCTTTCDTYEGLAQHYSNKHTEHIDLTAESGNCITSIHAALGNGELDQPSTRNSKRRKRPKGMRCPGAGCLRRFCSYPGFSLHHRTMHGRAPTRAERLKAMQQQERAEEQLDNEIYSESWFSTDDEDDLSGSKTPRLGTPTITDVRCDDSNLMLAGEIAEPLQVSEDTSSNSPLPQSSKKNFPCLVNECDVISTSKQSFMEHLKTVHNMYTSDGPQGDATVTVKHEISETSVVDNVSTGIESDKA